MYTNNGKGNDNDENQSKYFFSLVCYFRFVRSETSSLEWLCVAAHKIYVCDRHKRIVHTEKLANEPKVINFCLKLKKKAHTQQMNERTNEKNNHPKTSCSL